MKLAPKYRAEKGYFYAQDLNACVFYMNEIQHCTGNTVGDVQNIQVNRYPKCDILFDQDAGEFDIFIKCVVLGKYL